MNLTHVDSAWQRAGTRTDSKFAAALIGAAAVTLGYALQRSNGTLEPVAFALTGGVLLLTLATIGASRLLPAGRDWPAVGLLAAGFTGAIAIHLTTPPGIYLQVGMQGWVLHHALVGAAAVLVGSALSDPPFLRRLHVPALLLVHFALGWWLLKASPSPSIDVWVWHNEAYRALGQSANPYALTMPNIYGSTQWFAPGMADATRVFVGYPYPPLTLLFGGLGHLATGDYRAMNLLAITAAGGFMAYSRPGRLASTAAAVFLFTPRGLFVLEQGWTEALGALALAGTVFCACRFPKALPWVFGLMVGIKQYFIFAVPLVPLLLGTVDLKTNAKFLLKAAILPALLTVPFVIWNPQAFFASVVAFQAKQPFRAEALSVLAFTARGGEAVLPLNISFVALFVPLALGLWRAPRTPAGFALVFSAALLGFFFFAKQAFANYYFLVTAGLSLGVAATHSTPPAQVSSASTEGSAAQSGPFERCT